MLKRIGYGLVPLAVLLAFSSLACVVGLLTLLPVLSIEYWLGIHSLDRAMQWTAGLLAGKMGLILLLALLISFIEELLFRGFLITTLGRKMPLLAAAWISAFYYASLHFLRSHSQIPSGEAT